MVGKTGKLGKGWSKQILIKMFLALSRTGPFKNHDRDLDLTRIR